MKPKTNSSTSTPSATSTKAHIPHNLSPEEKREIASEICERISEGEFLGSICREEGMPHPNTLRNWMARDRAIASNYATAQDLRIETVLEMIMRIVSEPLPTYKDARGNVRIDPAAVSALKIRIQTLRWMTIVLKNHQNSEPQAHPVPAASEPIAPSAPSASMSKKSPAERAQQLAEIQSMVPGHDLSGVPEHVILKAFAEHLEEEAFMSRTGKYADENVPLYHQNLDSSSVEPTACTA